LTHADGRQLQIKTVPADSRAPSAVPGGSSDGVLTRSGAKASRTMSSCGPTSSVGKPIEGDLGVDVDKTEPEFLGLDEQLPREHTKEFEGLDDAEEDLEDDFLRFARSFDHKGVSP